MSLLGERHPSRRLRQSVELSTARVFSLPAVASLPASLFRGVSQHWQSQMLRDDSVCYLIVVTSIISHPINPPPLRALAEAAGPLPQEALLRPSQQPRQE